MPATAGESHDIEVQARGEFCSHDLHFCSTMNWDDLKIFLAVARSQRLAVAAKTLGLDATTVSRRIERLSQSLGATLFEAGTAGHVLSERGVQLLHHVEAIESAALAARGEVGGERGVLSGTVRVSVAEGFRTWVIARHLAAFHRAHPRIVVELIAATGFLNPSKREADIAVMLARPTTGAVVARRLTGYRLRLYAAPAYLASAPPLVSPEQLRSHSVIGYVPDIVYSPALEYMAEIRPGTEPDIRSSSINAQHAMTAAGAGVCVLPCFIAAQDPGLVRVLPMIEIDRRFWLVVHQGVRQVARVAAFVDWLVALVESERELLQGSA